MDAKKCGLFIATLRKDRLLTQTQLASVLGVTDKAISRWETGKGFPDVESLVKLSDFFNVTANELLLGERRSETSDDQALLEMCYLREHENRTFKTILMIAGVITFLALFVSAFLAARFFYRLNQTQPYPPQVLTQDLLAAESVDVYVDNVCVLDEIDFLFVSELRMDEWALTGKTVFDEKADPIAIVKTKGDNAIIVCLYETYAYATLENYAAERFVGTYVYPDDMALNKDLLLE